MNNLDAALASLSLPEPSVESIQASGLRPDAFIYLTVQHQRVVRYQISFIFACWLATITIILYPKRLIRLFQRLLWILNVVFACCTGKRNIKNYRQFINKVEKGGYCEKCDATRHGQGDGTGEAGRSSPGRVSMESIPLSHDSMAPLIKPDSQPSTTRQEKGVIGAAREYLFGAPKKSGRSISEAMLEMQRMHNDQMHQRDVQLQTLTREIQMLKDEQAKKQQSTSVTKAVIHAVSGGKSGKKNDGDTTSNRSSTKSS